MASLIIPYLFFEVPFPYFSLHRGMVEGNAPCENELAHQLLQGKWLEVDLERVVEEVGPIPSPEDNEEGTAVCDTVETSAPWD